LSAGTIPALIGPYNANYVFAGITGIATIYLWDPPTGTYLIYDYDDTFGAWDPSEPTFYPGQGYFVYTLQPQTFNPLFSFGGEGVAADQGPPPLSENTYVFQGSPTGLSATYEEIFGGAPTNETTLMRFIPGSSDFSFGSAHYNFYYYKDSVWTPQTPLLNPLEPVFVIFPYLSIKYAVTGHPQKIDMTWPSRGKLEEADTPFGTWGEVSGTVANTYSITVYEQSPGKYYRVKE